MVGLELEVIAKKLDRFGWERDRGTYAHDRMMTDWMDVLQDYPIEEIRAACRAVLRESPNKMPNEGHVYDAIMKARAAFVEKNRRPVEEVHQTRPMMDEGYRARADEMLRELGFKRDIDMAKEQRAKLQEAAERILGADEATLSQAAKMSGVSVEAAQAFLRAIWQPQE